MGASCALIQGGKKRKSKRTEKEQERDREPEPLLPYTTPNLQLEEQTSLDMKQKGIKRLGVGGDAGGK